MQQKKVTIANCLVVAGETIDNRNAVLSTNFTFVRCIGSLIRVHRKPRNDFSAVPILLLSMNSRALFPLFLVFTNAVCRGFFCHPHASSACHARLAVRSCCLPFFCLLFWPSCLFGETRAHAMLLHPSCQRVKHRRFGDGRKRTALVFHLHYFLFLN